MAAQPLKKILEFNGLDNVKIIRIAAAFEIARRIVKNTMGKVYKDKKSKGCALCKPHKHGWAPKKKAKIIAFEKVIIIA